MDISVSSASQAAPNTSGHLRGALAGISTAGTTNVGIASRIVQENPTGWNSGDGSNNQQHSEMRAATPLAYAIFQPSMGTFFKAASQPFFPAHPAAGGSALVGRGHPLFFTNGFGPSAYAPYFAHYPLPTTGSTVTMEHSPITSAHFQYPLHHLTGIPVPFTSAQPLSNASVATTNVSSNIQLPSTPDPPTLAFGAQPRILTGSAENPTAIASSSHSADQGPDVVFPAFVFDDDDSSLPQDLTTKRHDSNDTSPEERRYQAKSSDALVYAKPMARPRKPKPAKCLVPSLHVSAQKIPSLFELFASNRSQPTETFIQAASSSWSKQTKNDFETSDYWEFLQNFRAKNCSFDKQSVAARCVLSLLPQTVRDEIGLREPRKVPSELLDHLKLINREFEEDEHIECETPVESADVDSNWLTKFARELTCETEAGATVQYLEDSQVPSFLLGVGLEEISAKSASEAKRTVSKANHPRKYGKGAVSKKTQLSSAKRDGLKKEIDKALVDLKERMAKLKRRISVVKRISKTEAHGDDTQTEDLTVQLHEALSE